jgi:uncharacterized protein YbaP (TraB family)
MMRRLARLLPALTILTLAPPTAAAPALWEVRDDDSAVWIFGSFHVLPPDIKWRTELFDKVLDDADKVFFEADVGGAATAELGAKAFARGIYTDGTLLTDVLNDPTEQRLREIATTINLPIGPVLAMRPWFAASTISMGALAAEGFSIQGVEYVLQPELTAGRQGFLETGDQQLDVLAGAPDDEQIAMLEATLAEMHNLPKLMEKMLANWVEGTPDQLADLFLMEMGGYEVAFMDRLIYARNKNWLAPLEGMLDNNEENLVIVGAAHLIGDGSVLDLLDKAGYEVERIQ